MDPTAHPWRSSQEALLDGAVLTAAALLAWVLPLILPEGRPSAVPLVGTVGFLVTGATLLALQRRPLRHRLAVSVAAVVILTVSTLITPEYVATAADPTNLWMPLAPAMATYASYLYHQDRLRAWTVIGLLALVVVRPWDSSVTIASSGLVYVVAPMLFGFYLAARRMLVYTLVERAERAERERDLRAERARTEERVRLAAELHDVVTHRISLMVLHAGALRITATDDETRRLAEEIRSTGSLVLTELRDLIGVLRTPPEPGTEPSDAKQAEGGKCDG